MTAETIFTASLLVWSDGIQRPMPWKGERDPYKIWLSEIILQQTRVEQGLPYYLRFLEHFPNVFVLAAATEDEVFKCWEGLGYYTRARNLHTTARFIAESCNGVFPSTYEDIRALKGVGDYTAAAIAAFAYDLPYAVLDGNVYRVLSRFFGIATPIDVPAGKKAFAALATRLLATPSPARYNQAIMDFGALQCTPKQPDCSTCPMLGHCVAQREGIQHQLPVKSKNLLKKDRIFIYAVMQNGSNIIVRQRENKDIWRRLYDFPMREWVSTNKVPATDPQALFRFLFDKEVPEGLALERVSKPYKQQLTHQSITTFFVEITAENDAIMLNSGRFLAENSILAEQFKLKKIYALPRVVDKYWQEKNLSLSLF